MLNKIKVCRLPLP